MLPAVRGKAAVLLRVGEEMDRIPEPLKRFL
jgi:hypothetical protein